MKYRITKLQFIILKWIAKKIVTQSAHHENNIIAYYQIIQLAAKDEFTEDGDSSLDSFLTRCHAQAFKAIVPYEWY